MANYSLVINSQFHPFSYQELLQPALMATEAQHNLEDQYADLEAKSSVWEGLANEQTDPKTYRRYKAYADELQATANDLADYGLTPSSRQKLASMRAKYSSQILPIQNAYQTRLEQAKEQRQALNQNPTLMLSRRAATTSLDDYMDNPMLDYQSYSGALLTQQVAQMANKLKGELTSYGSKPLDKFTNLFLQKHGLSSQEVLNAINNPKASGSARILNAMVNDAVESSGMKGWADDATMKQAYKYAWQGAWNAVGQTTASPYENKQAVMDYDFAQKKALMDYQNQLSNSNNDVNLSPSYNTRAVMTNKEYDDANTYMSKYKNYFIKTGKGNWTLTAAGRKEAQKTHWGFVGPKGARSSMMIPMQQHSEFYNWLASNGLTGMVEGKTGPWQTKRLNSIIGKVTNSTDASLSHEYTRTIDPDQYKNVAAMLNSSSRNGQIQTYDIANEGGKYTLKKGKQWKVSKELDENDITSATNVFGDAGNYVEITLKGGKGEKIRVPLSQINAGKNDLINSRLREAKGLDMNAPAIQDRNGLWYKPDNLMMKYLNQASDNAMSIWGVSKTDEDKVTQGEYY